MNNIKEQNDIKRWEQEDKEDRVFTDWCIENDSDLKQNYLDTFSQSELKEIIYKWLEDEFFELHEEGFARFQGEQFDLIKEV